MKSIFNYERFSNSKKWNRNEFLNLLGIEVCPYCNRQYITVFNKENKNRSTADLDHYYAQSEYPFLALSIYNFIPSCAICNRNFKKARNEEIIYPYDECFEDIDLKFTTKFNEDSDFTYLLGEDLKFDLVFTEVSKEDEEKINRAQNSKEIFNLENVYQSHKIYVQGLIKRFYFYNESWIEEIVTTYGAILSLDRKDIIELQFGNYLSVDDFKQKAIS